MDTNELEENRQKLELVMKEINRQFGANSILRYGTDNIAPWPYYSTGALTLDYALGIGGLPKGRIVEVFGPESSGKSTLCLSVVANAQREGGICAYIDAEHSLDPQYARQLGVDMDELLLSQPDYGEQALDILLKLVRSGAVAVVVIDSVAALTPKAEIDGDMETQSMGLAPRMMSKNMRMLVAIAAETGTLVLFTNQIREKIGIMFGNPETTPGGRALRFFASVRIDLRRIEDIKSKVNGELLGVRTKGRVIKNKMAPPFRIGEFDILYGRGVNTLGCIVDLCETKGVLTKSGAWYRYEGEAIGNGRDQAIAHLASDMEFAELIKKQALAA